MGGTLSPRRADLLSVTLTIGFFCVAVSQAGVSVTAPLLRAELGFSAGQVGLLMSALLLAYGMGQIPAGALAGRFGGRVVVVGFAVIALGSALFALSSGFYVLLAARVLQGLGASAMLPSAGVLLARLVPVNRLGRAWAIYGAGSALGNLFSFLVLARLGAGAGFRSVFVAALVLAVLGGVASLLLPEIRRSTAASLGLAAKSRLDTDLRQLVRLGGVPWLVLVNVAGIALMVGVQTWTPSFMHDVHGASVAAASSLTAGYAAAQLLAAPMVAMLSRRVPLARLLLLAFLGMVVCAVLVPLLPGVALGFVAMVGIGFFGMASFAPAFSMIPMIVEPRLVGLASGFFNGTGFLGALAAPWLFGLMLDAGWGYAAGYFLLAAVASTGILASVALGRRRLHRALP